MCRKSPQLKKTSYHRVPRSFTKNDLWEQLLYTMTDKARPGGCRVRAKLILNNLICYVREPEVKYKCIWMINEWFPLSYFEQPFRGCVVMRMSPCLDMTNSTVHLRSFDLWCCCSYWQNPMYRPHGLSYIEVCHRWAPAKFVNHGHFKLCLNEPS